MDSWTPSRQLCVWQIAEGLSRHVPIAAVELVNNGAAEAVRHELLDSLDAGRARQEWRREKTLLVAQLVNTAEALCRHSATGRTALYALPSRFGAVLGEDESGVHFDDHGPLQQILPLLLLSERFDAVLLTACLTLLASLVLSANGPMLVAISEIVCDVHPVLKLAQAPALPVIIARATAWRSDDMHLVTLAAGLTDADGGDEPARAFALSEVTDEAVLRMLRALVEVMTAYAKRAEEWRVARMRHSRNEGPSVDGKRQEAMRVTDMFDEEGRDRILFALLNNTDDMLRISGMQCLSLVPMNNLQPEEVEELVSFVHKVHGTHQVYVGRNEEQMVHAFNAFARLVRVPDSAAPSNAGGSAALVANVIQMHVPRSAGDSFRRDHADLVLLALSLLVENSRREIPEFATAEREQKSALSSALTAFLIACSGPAEGLDAEPDVPPVWPQAVSVLQMRDATQSMLQVMRNEELYGDPLTQLPLEKSALADTVEPLLFTLPQLSADREIKARILGRLAELLEGDFSNAGGAPWLNEGGHWPGESAMSRRSREQQHVSFLRGNGVDLVLTQLENELSELKQIAAHEQGLDADIDVNGEGVPDNLAKPALPAEAAPDMIAEMVSRVLQFVEVEERRYESRIPGYYEGDNEQLDDNALSGLVDWKNFGIGALYSPELHLMPDDVTVASVGLSLPTSTRRQGVISGAPLHGENTPATVSAPPLSGAERGGAQLETDHAKWTHTEGTVAASLRVLTACVRNGSLETTGHFLERMSVPSSQHDVLMLAGYAGVFNDRQQSPAALRFVRFWNELLRALSARQQVEVSMLPLLDTLSRLLPRLLLPWASRMATSLDMWEALKLQLGAGPANAFLLDDRRNGGGNSRMLTFLVHLAGLYSMMLTALSTMSLSKQEKVDVAAKELTMRRILPPGVAHSISCSAPEPPVRGPTATPHSALVSFISFLFYDSVLRQAEGWEPHASGSGAHDSLARQETIGAIKGVLGSFCVLDEERRFELFQLTARLEARWGLPLPPALMHSITEIAEQALYKRALDPFLRREKILEVEDEKILDAAWMVQEAPRRRKHVLVLVSSRALYLLETPRLLGVCNVCESWKLCPTGPRLSLRVPLHRVSEMQLDFSAACGAGHRFKLVVTSEPKASKMGLVRTDCCASSERDMLARDPPVELQFSSLYVGVAQRLLAAMRRVHPCPPPIILDNKLPRVIQLLEAHSGSKCATLEREVDPPTSNLRLVMRCERLDSVSRGAPRERLLVVNTDSVSLYLESPTLFGVSPWRDQVRADQTRRDGIAALKKDASIPFHALGTIELEMSPEPRAKLAKVGASEAKPASITLQFADDTGAMLFRSRMREVLWGKGQTTWAGNTLAQTCEP